MIDGVFQHQDSNGGGGLITDGDTQWMTCRDKREGLI
jgi:quercetin 2,3-dioxygenase